METLKKKKKSAGLCWTPASHYGTVVNGNVKKSFCKVDRLYLHALSLVWVPDSSNRSAHLQRLHTEGLLQVSCPVPCQAFPVRQPWHHETHTQTHEDCFFFRCALFFAVWCIFQRDAHQFLWASWTGLTELSASAAECASLPPSASPSLLTCQRWGSVGPAGCWWPRLKRNRHWINTERFEWQGEAPYEVKTFRSLQSLSHASVLLVFATLNCIYAGFGTGEAVQVFSQLRHWVFLQQPHTHFLHLPGQSGQTCL